MDDSYTLHLIVGFALAVLAIRWPWAVVLALAAGPIKELADLLDGDARTQPDWFDLAWTWLGACLGWVCAGVVRALRGILGALVEIAARPRI